MNWKKACKPFPFQCANVEGLEEDLDVLCRCLFCRQSTIRSAEGPLRTLRVQPQSTGTNPRLHGPLQLKDHSASAGCWGGLQHGPRRADHLRKKVCHSPGAPPESGGTYGVCTLLSIFSSKVCWTVEAATQRKWQEQGRTTATKNKTTAHPRTRKKSKGQTADGVASLWL